MIISKGTVILMKKWVFTPYIFKGRFSTIYRSPRTKRSIQKESLQKSDESKVVSEFAIFGQKWAKMAPRKKRPNFFCEVILAPF